MWSSSGVFQDRMERGNGGGLFCVGLFWGGVGGGFVSFLFWLGFGGWGWIKKKIALGNREGGGLRALFSFLQNLRSGVRRI